MSRAEDLAYLHAQRASITEQLARLRPEQRLMHVNLDSRLRVLDDEIAVLNREAALSPPVSVTLTFGGEPVVGSRAIDATFGAEAVQAFQKLVSMTAATRMGRKLSATGRIPDERRSRLFITGTAPGSFGFELEALGADPEHDPAALRDAVEETARLLEATQTSDEAFEDAVSQGNPRVLRALADFLTLVDGAGATLRLRAMLRECAFETRESVREAAERARVTHMAEAEEELRGVLLGVLPIGRRFEYRIAETGEIINGRIAREIEDPQTLKLHLEKPSIAAVWIVTLERGGNERRTYYLYGIRSETSA